MASIGHATLIDGYAHLGGDITFDLLLAITLGFPFGQILNDLFFKLSIAHLALPMVVEGIL